MHLGQVAKHIRVGHDAATVRCVLKIVQHSVHLVEIALGIMALLANLVPVGLADGAGTVGPAVPDVAPEIVDVVRLLLPDPQQLVDAGLEIGAAHGEDGKLLGKVVAVNYPELFHRVCTLAVIPPRADLEVGVPHAVFKNILAVTDKNFVCSAHFDTSN